MRKPISVQVILGLIFSLFTANLAIATEQQYWQRGDGSSLEGGWQAIASEIPHGSVLVVGEEHGKAEQAQAQIALLEALRAAGHKVSVGMEFVAYPFQRQLNQYQLGEIAEAEFLEMIGWGSGFSFDFYREQILFSPSIWAINAPRSLTSKVAKSGLESLTEEEKSLMPPHFEIGNEAYFKRFINAIGHLPSPDAGKRYFTAQSIWDDTMAWRVSLALETDSDHTMVIIVGEFHVQYGGGLPSRLVQRNEIQGRPVVSMSLVNSKGLTPQELESELLPHTEYGPRADYIWVGHY